MKDRTRSVLRGPRVRAGGDLPPKIGSDVMAYAGCIAGAILIEDYVRDLHASGFESVQVVDTRKDLNAYAKIENQSGCCSPGGSGCTGDAVTSDVHDEITALLRKYNANDYAASVQVYALKPR